MLLKSVSINNFRGFKNLEIKDFKQATLLIGKNNCGKTSVLEALFLLIGGNNPMLPINIHKMRQMSFNSDNDFRYLFNDFDIGNTINISAETTNSKKMNLEISSLIGLSEINNSFNNGENKEIFMRPGATEIRKNDLMGGLCYKFTKTSGESSVHNFSITSTINATILASYGVAEIHGIYINSRNMVNMAAAFGDLVRDSAENEIIDVLKEISDIVDIRMSANNIVLVGIKGKNERQPINIVGDGIIKIVSILSFLRQVKKGGILLIDEIENGLYYSSSSLMLWKAIFKACRTYNVQIVATTHSRECIENFYVAYKDEKLSDGISLVRLDKKDNDIRVVSYNEMNIKTAIEYDMEVR
jgi:AAA15 family ATPase/GTPase